MTGFSMTAMVFAGVCALLLALGGMRLLRQPQFKTRGVLMIVAALVILTNVMIWTV